MENLVRDIGITIAAVLICIYWWYVAKDPASRKYIFLWGTCFLLAGVAYIMRKIFDMPALSILAFFALISAIIFFIKVALLEHRAKKKVTDDK
jgi:hypothetical protein